jgi:hypothetical protein
MANATNASATAPNMMSAVKLIAEATGTAERSRVAPARFSKAVARIAARVRPPRTNALWS